jgi:hypothetical protein
MADSARLPPGRLGRAGQLLAPGIDPAQSRIPVVGAGRVGPYRGEHLRQPCWRSISGLDAVEHAVHAEQELRAPRSSRPTPCPGPLRAFAEHQPFTPTVETMRGLWMGIPRPALPSATRRWSPWPGVYLSWPFPWLPPPGYSATARPRKPVPLCGGAGAQVEYWAGPKAQRGRQRRRVHDGQVLSRAGEGHVKQAQAGSSVRPLGDYR